MEKIIININHSEGKNCNIAMETENENSVDEEKIVASRIYSAIINEIESMKEKIKEKKTKKNKKEGK